MTKKIVKPFAANILSGCLLLLFSAAHAQQNPPKADAKEETIELGAFVVNAEKDTGYAATDSLAGTRLRTPLKDIAASVSVVTKDLMEDLSAKGTADLLVYTTGTEVVGIGGNYSASTSDTAAQNFESRRESANPSTRVRGLAGADQTRNYFLSPTIPADAYNSESATLNRGANAILFGFGSPAGIVEYSSITPQFRNRGQARASVGSYGSHRESLDVERVLLPRIASLRLAVLSDRQQYEQEPAFKNQDRVYGALTFKPFKTTTLRVNMENGQIDQRLPRVDPPVDSLTSWWDFGKPTRNNDFTSTATKNYQRANNLDGMAGNWSQNVGLIYFGVDQALPSDATVPCANVPGTTYRFLAPRSSQEIAANVSSNPLAGFMVGKQLIDRSIFDYRTQMIDGPNNGTWLDFNTQNIALEQIFLGGAAGVEVVYDRQKSVSSVLRTISTYRGNNIFIDVNTVTVDGRPNPNFGRPFISSNGYYNYDENEFETGRATAYLRHDFSKGRAGLLGRLLGRHTLTGMYSDYSGDQYYRSGYNAAVEPSFRDGLNGNTLATSRKISSVVYLGPSLAGAATPVGAHLQGVQTPLVVPETVDVWVTNVGTGYKWVQQRTATHQYPEYEYLTTNVTANTNKARSSAAIWQGDWWDNALVTTVGWRHDTVETATGNASGTDPLTGSLPLARPVVPNALETTADTLSHGIALHVPDRWMRRLPGGLGLSLYYNQSENFDVSAGVRRNILGDYLPPQEGSTREYGFGLRTLDNRLSLRATWYNTTQDNMTDGRVSGVLVRAVDLESRITGSLSKAFLDSIGYVGFDSPKASPLFKRYLENYNYRVGSLRADGTRLAEYTTPPGTADLTSSISRGLELEAVYNPTRNWRILANAAKQEAVRGDTSATLAALIADRLPQWQNPALWPLTLAGGVQRVDSYTTTYMTNPLNTAKLSSGERTPELRRWRLNLVTNYSFDKDTRLAGWGVGGAVRWQDRIAIGYPVINDPVLGLVTDIRNPFMGASESSFDGWVNYQHKLWRGKVGWKIQLNVRNLLDDNRLIPVKANPVAIGDLKAFDVAAYRIGAGRTWELTSSFSF